MRCKGVPTPGLQPIQPEPSHQVQWLRGGGLSQLAPLLRHWTGLGLVQTSSAQLTHHHVSATSVLSPLLQRLQFLFPGGWLGTLQCDTDVCPNQSRQPAQTPPRSFLSLCQQHGSVLQGQQQGKG